MKNWPCQICYVNINSPYMQYCLFTDLWIHVSDLINTSWNWMVWVQIQTQEDVTILSRTNNNMFLLQFLCKSKWININMWGLWRHHARSLAAMRRLPLSPAVPPWCCSEKHYLFLHAVPWHTQYTACTNTRRTYTHSTCLVGVYMFMYMYILMYSTCMQRKELRSLDRLRLGGAPCLCWPLSNIFKNTFLIYINVFLSHKNKIAKNNFSEIAMLDPQLYLEINGVTNFWKHPCTPFSTGPSTSQNRAKKVITQVQNSNAQCWKCAHSRR